MDIEHEWEASGYHIKYPQLNKLFNILITEHGGGEHGESNIPYGRIGKEINKFKTRLLELPKEEQDSLLNNMEHTFKYYNYESFSMLSSLLRASWERLQRKKPGYRPGCTISRKSRKSKSRKSKSRKSKSRKSRR